MRRHFQHVVLIAVCSTVASFASVRADAGIVYIQDATYPGAFTAWTSSAATGTAVNQGWTTYDDFLLTGPANIQKIAWEGFYLGNTGNLPNTVDWKFEIYESKTVNSVFQPDFSKVKASTLVTTDKVKRASQGFARLNNGADVLVYDFHVILENFFPTAAAGTRYWLLIESLSGNNDPVWAWMSGRPGNGTSLQQQQGSSSFFQRPDDRVFVLYDDTIPLVGGGSHGDPPPKGGLNLNGGGFSNVPEPSSWVVFGILGACCSLVPFVRSRRR